MQENYEGENREREREVKLVGTNDEGLFGGVGRKGKGGRRRESGSARRRRRGEESVQAQP